MRTRTFVITGLLVALLVAGFGSYYASSHPDGLQYVADRTGFGDSAKDSPTSDSPFANYDTAGVDDERLGGGLAGVIGVLLTLVIAGGVAYAVRRRTPAEAEH
ncbi:hypothetical protein NPS01_25990 [Nocardioides psychrotolerans]|nr:PDGLE domain-containing protein [Nocardioides psychrotolerans]GEP38936.1 hypothetical protein NPS01_25990 [Nocardioides psychrotolerans]